MRRDMEIEDMEAALEKIWDLHDKLSDAIHSITRAHFLDTIKTLSKGSGEEKTKRHHCRQAGDEEQRTLGCVFVKDFAVHNEAILEAKSLNSIRSALENLEDRLEFVHTVQIQQRAERDAAIAGLEQSRIVLAMRLAEHHGKKYKVIEEALAFVGDVRDANHFILSRNSIIQKGNILMKVLVSSLSFAKSSLRLDLVGGIMGNAALVAVTMMALLNFNRMARKDVVHKHRCDVYSGNDSRRPFKLPEIMLSKGRCSQLDVRLARG